MHTNKRISQALAALALTAIAITSSPADASWRRVSNTACKAAHAPSGDVDEFGNFIRVRDGSAYIVCPLEDDSSIQKSDIERINVHTQDSTSAGNNFARAYVCAQNPFGTASGCGMYQGASGFGYNTLTLNSAAELDYIREPSRAAYFGWIEVYMQSTQTSGNGQQFFGYWLSDT